MEERTGGTRAGPWALDWGQVATGCLRGGLVGPSHSPARSAPWREAPASTIKRAPPRPCRAGSTARGAGQGRFPHRVFDPDAPRAQQPVHGCSDGDAATAVGVPWWSARGRGRGSRPGVDHGVDRLQRPARAALWTAPGRTASVIFGDCPVPAQRPPRSWTPGGGRFAHRHARAYKLMIIESRPPGPALSPWAILRGPERACPAPWGPPVSKGPTSEVDGLCRTPASSCWDAPTEPTRLFPQFQMIGQFSGQPAFQGHSSSEAGSRPPVPVITGPARIDPLEQAVQRPTGTQPLHHTRARQHEPSHHQSSRIDPFKSKGYTDN